MAVWVWEKFAASATLLALDSGRVSANLSEFIKMPYTTVVVAVITGTIIPHPFFSNGLPYSYN